MMRQIRWNVSERDELLIDFITARAAAIYEGFGLRLDRVSLEMDLTAVHANGCRMRLADLLDADDFNFTHDVGGIMKYLDRTTAQLTNHFLPRFAEPQRRRRAA